MSSAPYGVRLLVGVAAAAVEETRKLPQTIMMYPMTVASQVAHLVMKMQQDVADLVIKGDATLETLFPEGRTARMGDVRRGRVRRGGADSGSGERMTEGRFALYSVDSDDIEATSAPEGGDEAHNGADQSAPAVADRIDYGSLTLAQLRARLQSLSVDELNELLAYEEATKARAPFQTLLANRITRASAK